MAIERPSLRSLTGTLLLVGGLIVYALLAMQLGAIINGWPIWGQTVIYVIVGLAWLWPAKHLLGWMGRGRRDQN
ncbi:hypothetical protein GCM10007972_13320 [Iodidimonas muriae]|uniref:DUF2842 domain-containing protein n=1 Tax=Iodidimonas muriae TaxID=261467 RepID=A0ABQ2LEH2_9PROT|nr:DUF2842 domain-containing protein [Iodidimonas muriae]GER07444.1 hypothetical protein JCM17843_17540 [Kordiimonadales bacterium JCM 17843]GGO10483.1 hypothetical protein GCM10007972_13320 [Iodidimonas muriae]